MPGDYNEQRLAGASPCPAPGDGLLGALIRVAARLGLALLRARLRLLLLLRRLLRDVHVTVPMLLDVRLVTLRLFGHESSYRGLTPGSLPRSRTRVTLVRAPPERRAERHELLLDPVQLRVHVRVRAVQRLQLAVAVEERRDVRPPRLIGVPALLRRPPRGVGRGLDLGRADTVRLAQRQTVVRHDLALLAGEVERLRDPLARDGDALERQVIAIRERRRLDHLRVRDLARLRQPALQLAHQIRELHRSRALRPRAQLALR